MSNNTASAEGGGVYLRQSTLELIIYLFLFSGGIHAISSAIIVNQPAALHLKGNIAAEMGGGTYLRGSSKINLLCFINNKSIYSVLTENHATTGGAILIL